MRHLLALSAALTLALPAAAQETAAFVISLGKDTLAVERYTRSASSLVGELILRAPRTRVITYTADLNPDGTVSRVEMLVRPIFAPGTHPARPPRQQRNVITFGRDTAVVEQTQGDSTRTMRVAAAAGAMPLVTQSYVFYEQAVMVARKAKRDSVRVALVAPGSANAFVTHIVRRGADSVMIDYFGMPGYARVDADGRILGYDGTATTQKFIVSRVSDVDFDGLSREFAARDASGQPVGALSPRDTARATIGNARLVVDYGRPAKRGRTVWGGLLVPFNQVWRTGANAATQLQTSADLVVGGTTIPAGKYTLWTLHTPSGATLIVNKQTGQWGTEYRQEQDLVRLPVQVSSVASAVEQLTIAVAPTASGGVLTITWDTTRLSLPFTTK